MIPNQSDFAPTRSAKYTSLVTARDTIVELSGASVRVGLSTIVRKADLRASGGEVIGLFGANGSGKTTLLRLMATLLRPASGIAVVLGADVATPERFAVRHRIGLIGHVPSLYPELTLRQNLQFLASFVGSEIEAADEALDRAGLAGAANRRADACSYGMQRRAEFARELLRRPELVLLDEPHSALDSAATALVDHLVRDVTDRGGAAVLVSHDRERVEKLVDATFELAEGVGR